MYLKKVIFVCLGNICRSPSAEGVMQHLVKENGLDTLIFVDSAGTAAYHTGERADSRMRKHASQRGYDLTSIARKFNPKKDFNEYDYIIAMDNDNYNNLLSFDVDKKYRDKIFRMVEFCRNVQADEVPDPYYGGGEGFELVIDILEDACAGLLERIKNDLGK
ncbi:MAG: low molecular weight protein-tyrosine-phosphatase [Ignavibacteriaceae bacterium]